LSQFHELDDQRSGAWPATQLTAGASYTFTWHLTAPHSTTDFKYYLTKQGWDQNAPLMAAHDPGRLDHQRHGERLLPVFGC
jgi:predicted carbohydrate-binding protein with CBM5 and CBM33 domain